MQVQVDSREVMMFSTEYNRFITIIPSIKCGCELGSSSESARESVSFDLVAVNMNDGLLLTSLNASSISRTPVPMCSLACSLIPSSSTVMLVGVTAKNNPMVLISEHPSGSLTCGDAVINLEGGETNLTVLAGGVEAGMLITRPFSSSTARILFCCSTSFLASLKDLPNRLSMAAFNKSAFFGPLFPPLLITLCSLVVMDV